MGYQIGYQIRAGRPIARTRTGVRSSDMWLAGIPVADRAVLRLAASLREAELVDTAERLERAYDREARIVALDVPDREAILRVLRGDARAAGDASRGTRLAAARRL